MYLFKSKLKRWIAGFFDAVGRLVFRSKKSLPADFKNIIVIRLDHLGDVVLSEPFLSGLSKVRPAVILRGSSAEGFRTLDPSAAIRRPQDDEGRAGAQDDGRWAGAQDEDQTGFEIVFLTTPGGIEVLGTLFKERVRFESFVAPWFHGSTGFLASWRGFFRLVEILKKIPADAVIDLRGDVRHILAARLAYPRAWIASYGVTGGGFLLDKELSYQPRVHAAERNLAFLEALGVSRPARPVLNPGMASAELTQGSTPGVERFHPRGGERRVALHPGTGTPAKAWPVQHWSEFLKKLERSGAEIIWIGDAAAGNTAKQIEHEAGIPTGRVKNVAGVLPLAQLGTFFKTCDLLVSADSGPVHLAAAVGLETVVLFSGTNEVHEWKPLSDHAHLLYHEVNCSPCHERVCPKPRHDCMEGITPDTVFEKVNVILRHGRAEGSKVPDSSARLRRASE